MLESVFAEEKMKYCQQTDATVNDDVKCICYAYRTPPIEEKTDYKTTKEFAKMVEVLGELLELGIEKLSVGAFMSLINTVIDGYCATNEVLPTDIRGTMFEMYERLRNESGRGLYEKETME